MYHRMGGMMCPTCGYEVGYGHKMGGLWMRGMGFMKMMFKKMPWKVMTHADELGLSEDQVESLRNRHVEAKKQMVQIGSQIKINMIDLKNAVMREEMDYQTAEAKAKEIGRLKGEKLTTMLQAMKDMRNILTPDQRMKIREMVMSWFKEGKMAGMEMEEEEEESGEMSEE